MRKRKAFGIVAVMATFALMSAWPPTAEAITVDGPNAGIIDQNALDLAAVPATTVVTLTNTNANATIMQQAIPINENVLVLIVEFVNAVPVSMQAARQLTDETTVHNDMNGATVVANYGIKQTWTTTAAANDEVNHYLTAWCTAGMPTINEATYGATQETWHAATWTAMAPQNNAASGIWTNLAQTEHIPKTMADGNCCSEEVTGSNAHQPLGAWTHSP